MRVVSVPCGECEGRVRDGDEFCTACGIPVSESVKAAIATRRAEKEEHELAKSDALEVEASRHARTLTLARWALLLLAAIELGQGLASFPDFVRQSALDVADVAKLEESYVWVDDVGDKYTKSELVWSYARAPGNMLVGKVTTAALLAVLFVLGRRAPLAALLAGGLGYLALFMAQGLDAGFVPKAILLLIAVAGARAAASMGTGTRGLADSAVPVRERPLRALARSARLSGVPDLAGRTWCAGVAGRSLHGCLHPAGLRSRLARLLPDGTIESDHAGSSESGAALVSASSELYPQQLPFVFVATLVLSELRRRSSSLIPCIAASSVAGALDAFLLRSAL